MPEPKKSGRGFDRLAGVYDRCVQLIFGNRLNDLQKDILVGLPTKHTCLIIGGGTGSILRAVLDLNLAPTIVFAELSVEMIARASRRLDPQEQDRVHFTTDWEQVVRGTTFDYIILPFVLDCYREPTISRWLDVFTAILNPGGTLIVADFNHEKDFGFRPGAFHRLFIKTLYLFFRTTTSIEATRLPRISMLMHTHDYVCRKVIYKSGGWLQASLWNKNIAAVTAA